MAKKKLLEDEMSDKFFHFVEELGQEEGESTAPANSKKTEAKKRRKARSESDPKATQPAQPAF